MLIPGDGRLPTRTRLWRFSGRVAATQSGHRALRKTGRSTSVSSCGPAAQRSRRRAACGPSAALRGGPPSEPDGSRAPAQKNVGRTFTRDVLRAFIAQSTHIDVIQEMLPGTE
jgi:hypothetical protein